jgi:hypothetical protein
MISKYWDLFTLRKRCSLILISIAIFFIVVALVIFNNSSETKARFSPRSTIVVDPSTSYKTISDSEVIEPFVRSGAFQIESISYDNDFLSRAYINNDGDYVVIVKCNSGGNFSISGLASGNYAIRYTTANQSEVNLSNQTIYSGQPVVAEIPKAGVLVVYAVPSPLDDQIPTTPMDLTAYYLSPFKVKLKWEVSTDNTTVAGYMIYRDGYLIGFSQSNSFEDKKVRPTISYSYSVLAYDTSANKSSLSKPMIVVIPQLIEDKDLLGYWKFDEGRGSMIKDVSKNSRDGAMIGAEWTSATNGYVLYFDGVDDYVKINSDSSLDNLTAITMIAWIYPRVDSHWHVLDKGDGDKRLYAEGIKRMLEGRIRYSDMHAFSESKSDTIILNTWQHVALTWSRKTNKVRLFHNGLEIQYRIQDVGSGIVMDDSDYPFTIGTRGALDDPMFFTGYIDEVQLYKRALNSQEIQAVYNWSAHQFSSRSEPVK